MYSTVQNASSVRMPQNFLSEGQANHFGIRWYKNAKVPSVEMKDTRHRWNILVLLSEAYAPDMGCINPGLYTAPVLDFVDGIRLGNGFKGYLLSIPFDTWKLFDIHNLDLYFESRSFIPYVALDKKDLRSLVLMMDVIGSALESDGGPFNEMELIYVCRAFLATLNRHYRLQEPQNCSSTGNLIADRFIKLVEENCLQEKKLDFYAKELNVSAKYLSHIVASVTGKNANKWIADHVIDIGPEGGAKGGELVFAGTPEELIKEKRSYTAKFLADKLK